MRVKNIVALLGIGLLSTFTFGQKAAIMQLDSNVYAISLMHYTSLVVIGTDEVLITDPANPFRASILKNEIANITSKPVSKIVLTHEHYDHTGGTEVFEGAQIIAQKNVKNLEYLDPLDLFPDKIHILFNKNLTIDMGTTTIDLKYLGAADGAAIAVIYLPKEKIVVTSDMYTDEGIGAGKYLSHTNLLGTRKILKTILTWDIEHAVNTHSAITDTKHLKKTVAFLDDLYFAMMSRLLEVNKNNGHELLDEVMKMKETLTLPQYKDWENYSDLPIYIEKMGFAIIHGG